MWKWVGGAGLNLCDILKESWDVVINDKELWVDMGYTWPMWNLRTKVIIMFSCWFRFSSCPNGKGRQDGSVEGPWMVNVTLGRYAILRQERCFVKGPALSNTCQDTWAVRALLYYKEAVPSRCACDTAVTIHSTGHGRWSHRKVHSWDPTNLKWRGVNSNVLKDTDGEILFAERRMPRDLKIKWILRYSP